MEKQEFRDEYILQTFLAFLDYQCSSNAGTELIVDRILINI